MGVFCSRRRRNAALVRFASAVVACACRCRDVECLHMDLKVCKYFVILQFGSLLYCFIYLFIYFAVF